MAYKTWSQLDDESAARVAAELRGLDIDISKPSEQARVHVDHKGALMLAVWHATPIPAHAAEIDAGETWPDYLRVTGHLHPPAEAVAILRGPDNPEAELARRRENRAKCEARRAAAQAERDEKARQQLQAEADRRRRFEQGGGPQWDQLPVSARSFYALAVAVEQATEPALLPLATICRAIADDCAARSRNGVDDPGPAWPGREYRYNPDQRARLEALGPWVGRATNGHAPTPPPPSAPPTLAEQIAAKHAEYAALMSSPGYDLAVREAASREIEALEARQRREQLRIGPSA